MKATLEFELPQENDEFSAAVNGSKWEGVVTETLAYIRNQIKYNDALTAANIDVLTKVKETIYEQLNSEGLSL
jgi:hypothetical protein